MKKNSISPTRPTEEEIAKLAYILFEENGRQDGYDLEHWYQARAHLCTDQEHCGDLQSDAKPHRI